MDSLSRINEPIPDVGAAERVSEARRQAGERQKGAARRRAKRTPSAAASGDGGGSRAGQEGDRPVQADSGEMRPTDQERSEACYGRNRTVAPILPKGRVIDIAI